MEISTSSVPSVRRSRGGVPVNKQEQKGSNWCRIMMQRLGARLHFQKTGAEWAPGS
ncbi:hypothetical protein TRIUR3_34528 [Triticum urartu]|uniref:Uncharacterized protein n=1 Tax=Triticum urartu TaxID=4572 RepID=M8A5L3_TRIUA|nr:hypothetical protein TRIUR3_34528 [Triticum urartu]